MLPVRRLALLLIIGFVTATSCKKSAPKQTRFIPKDASVVVALHTKSLYEKATREPALLQELFQKISEGNDTAVNKGKQEWEDFKNAGIDLTEDFFVSVVNKGGNMMQGNSLISIIGIVKDEAKLQAYIKKKDATLDIRKDKNYSYIIKNNNIVAWKNDVVIAMTMQEARPQMEYDTATNSFNVRPGSGSQAALLAEVLSYFNLKEEQSIAAIPEFKEMVAQKADGSFWANSAATVSQIPIPLPKLKELTRNTFTAATMNFEDGRFVFDSKTYVSPALADLLKKYKGASADLSMVEKFPSNDINGFAVFAFNPELINGIVNYFEVGAMANNMVSGFMGPGYTLQQLLQAFKGNFAVIVSDLRVIKNTIRPMGQPASTEPSAKVLVNVAVGNQTQMNRILDKLVEQQMLTKENNQYVLSAALQSRGLSMYADDKNVLMSTDAALLTQYKQGSGKAALDNDVMKNFKDKSAVTYVNLQKVMNAFAVDSSTKALTASARETFVDIKGYAGSFDDGVIDSRYEVTFKNKTQNSLTSLLKFMSATATAAKQSGNFRYQNRSMPAAPDTSQLPGTDD